jgi:hypothetical protein
VPVACSAVFRQRVCHSPSCGAVFYLCPHCDRGQRYCSSRCRVKSRRRQRREANRRHQQSVEGRLDHRDRQRAYRRRLQVRVTDPSSLHASPCVNLTVPPLPELVEAPLADFFPGSDAPYAASWVICQICGRRGRWVNPFPEVQHDF